MRELVEEDADEVQQGLVLHVAREHGAEHVLVDARVELADVQLYEVLGPRLAYPLLDGVLCEYLPASRYGGRLVVAYLGHEHLGQTVHRDVVEALVLRCLTPDDAVLAVDRLDSVEVLDGCDRDAPLAYLGGEGARQLLLASVFVQKRLHLPAPAFASQEVADRDEAEALVLDVHALAVTPHCFLSGFGVLRRWATKRRGVDIFVS